MSPHRNDDDEAFLLIVLVLILILFAGWLNLRHAMDKCKKAGRSPASCYELLR